MRALLTAVVLASATTTAATAIAQMPAASTGAPASKSFALKSAAGADAGTVMLTAAPKGVLLRVQAKGLTPGWHGIHIHMIGDCSDAAMGFKKSGGHVHGDDKSVHGLLNPAATDTGDLPDIYADANGIAMADLYTGALTMAQVADADGSAVVIHAKPDDYMTQPIGGAGERVACAVVK